jgi:hypothetical protein
MFIMRFEIWQGNQNVLHVNFIYMEIDRDVIYRFQAGWMQQISALAVSNLWSHRDYQTEKQLFYKTDTDLCIMRC